MTGTAEVNAAIEALPPLSEVVKALDMRARKSLGQHFLVDESYLWMILQKMGLKSSDRVFEIGPGSGQMTKCIAPQCSSVTAIEVDNDCVEYLQQQAELKNCTFIHGDILRYDVAATQQDGAFDVWIGNLPYHISSSILMRTILFRSVFAKAYFMLQKEVVDRIVARPNTPSYGRLSVMMQAYFDVEKLFDVPPEAFLPPPKVYSSVVMLLPRVDYRQKPRAVLFESVVKKAFLQRRRMLKSIFREDVTVDTWQRLGLSGEERPEALDVHTYERLAIMLDT